MGSAVRSAQGEPTATATVIRNSGGPMRCAVRASRTWPWAMFVKLVVSPQPGQGTCVDS